MPETAATMDHVGMTVPDLDAALRFFADHFGAREVFRLPPITTPGAAARLGVPEPASFELVMLDIGGERLELLRWRPEATGDGPPPAHARGAVHLAISVPDLSVALERLAAVAGVRVIGERIRFTDGPTAGLATAFVTAPWGSLIELMEWPAGGRRSSNLGPED